MRKDIIIGIGIFLLFISILFDKIIALSIINYRMYALTGFMHVISFLGSAIAVMIITFLLFVFDKKKREYVPALLISLVLAISMSIFIKYLIMRPRPDFLPLEIKNGYSFPSSHAAAVFAPLAFIDKVFPKIKWIWLALAGLVLFSRIYLGVHYLSDVVAGALLGYIIGVFVLKASSRHF